MKKFLICILCTFLLFPCWGCQQQAEMVEPVSFYYPVANPDYSANDRCILPEQRECSELPTAEARLQAYLRGPLSEAFTNPFPRGLTIISLSVTDTQLNVTLSDHLGSLTGIDLTVACSCIAKTCMELYPVEQVSISAESILLFGERSITLTQENILLLDSTQ